MPGELATLFEGKEIRVFERSGEPWFPVSDLAIAWGIDRTTPLKILTRNDEAFRGFVCLAMQCDKMSPPDDAFCINERGLYLMIGKITTGKLKNREAAAAILKFQRWVPELIQKYRKKEIVQVTESKPLIQDEIDRAKLLAQVTGGELREFQKIALKKCGYGDYAPALDASPALIHGEPGVWMNPSDIGKECGLNPREVNSWLYNHDFQYPQGTLWRLTAKGEAYGEEYMYPTPYKHEEIRIRWHRSVLLASGLKKPESQTALVAKVA
ncbi:MAG: hypothetical protein M0Q91_05405 [Methanoregula sp.]|jgi:prophage antirepressor-like protein|nr:hypothetical protein [Methanoregula sp.]